MQDASRSPAAEQAASNTALAAEIERMRREAEYFRLVFAEAPIGMAIVAPDGRVLRANAVLCELLGYSADELERLTFQQFTHPADLDTDVALVERLLRGEIPRYQLAKRYLRKDGAVVDAMLSVSLVRDREGRPVHMIAQVEDVTERKRVEREREELTQRLRAVLDQAPVGILMIDGRRRDRVLANARAVELMGRAFVARCPDGVAEASTHVYRPDGVRLAFSELPSVRALRGEHVEGLELALRDDRGELLPVLFSAAPVVGAGGIEGAVVVFEDLTAMKELERLRAEWSSIVAHDLRAPLQSILLSTQSLERLSGDKEELRRCSARMTQTIGRLARAVSDLADSSRLEAGRVELARAPLDLVGIVRASAERLALQAVERRVDVHVGGALPPLVGDADRIAQVMDNLLGNAVKYGRAGTPIVVRVEPCDGEVAVSVTNEGAGIPREAMPHLFDRFFRTTAAKVAGIEGLGLGLYITRELVAAHGGSITAESEPGKTTTLRFTLPAMR